MVLAALPWKCQLQTVVSFPELICPVDVEPCLDLHPLLVPQDPPVLWSPGSRMLMEGLLGWRGVNGEGQQE